MRIVYDDAMQMDSGMQIESAKRLLLQKLPSAAAKELAAGSI